MDPLGVCLGSFNFSHGSSHLSVRGSFIRPEKALYISASIICFHATRLSMWISLRSLVCVCDGY